MDRDTALKQLQDIRQEILIIHSELESCQALQKRAEALHKEKERPSAPSVALKPENTADQLKRTLQEQNRERYASDRKPALAVKLVNIALQLLLCALLAMDLLGQKGIILHGVSMEKLMQLDMQSRYMLLGAQAILSLLVLLAPLFPDYFRRRGAVFYSICGLVLICYLYMMMAGIRAWTYAVLFAASVTLIPIAFGVIALLRKGRMRAPSLTASQMRQWRAACQADETAKAENARLRVQAQTQWEQARVLRLPEIDRELEATLQEFNERRKRIDRHMEKLSQMDALCEEEKTLQIVDLLIRFIQTRRADSVKEALQEYDKLMANRQLMEIEKQKLAAELQRAALEHADRMQQMEAQKKHQAEMEYLAWDSAQSRAKLVSQLNNIGNIIYYDLHG